MQSDTGVVADAATPAAEYARTKTARQRAAQRWRRGQPVPYIAYTAEEDALWATVTGALATLHRRVACDHYLRAATAVPLPADRVPQLTEVSAQLAGPDGFVLVPAPGVVPAKRFYGGFLDGVFHSTQYVRPATSPFHSPEPDVLHDLVGHSVMLADPVFAGLYRRFGAAARRVRSREAMTAVCRAFWFTMETGVVREAGELRAYGAALLSSVAEMEGLGDVQIVDFDLGRVLQHEIDDKKCQPTLYAVDSVERMDQELRYFLDRVE